MVIYANGDYMDKDEAIMYGCLLILIILLLGGVAYTRAYFEAQAYNRITGKEVTTWDAMFLDLRIQESVKD